MNSFLKSLQKTKNKKVKEKKKNNNNNLKLINLSLIQIFQNLNNNRKFDRIFFDCFTNRLVLPWSWKIFFGWKEFHCSCFLHFFFIHKIINNINAVIQKLSTRLYRKRRNFSNAFKIRKEVFVLWIASRR